MNTYTAVFVKDGDMYAAYAEELPGANTQGKTIEEAKENLKEAISMIMFFTRFCRHLEKSVYL